MKAIVAELGAKGPGDMGKVMGVVKTRLAGKADMGQHIASTSDDGTVHVWQAL